MKLMKELAFVFGDPQLDSAPGYDRPNLNTGRSTRFDEVVDVTLEAAREAWDRGCRVMVFLGDASENKNPVSVEMRALAFIFSEWIRWGGVVKAIPGNHDGSEYEVSSSSIEPLAMMRSAAEFSLYQKITWDPETNSIFVPYVHGASPRDIGEEMFLEMPESVSGPVTAFLHYGFEGAKAGPYERILPGDYLSAAQFEKILGLDYAYGGHIHKKNEGRFTFSDGRVVEWGHPGSTAIHGIDERNDVKGYYTHDFGKRVRTFYPIKQRRPWISTTFKEFREYVAAVIDEDAPPAPLWTEDALVRVDGVCPRDVSSDAVLAEAMKAGVIPRPFFLKNEVKPEAENRVARDSEVTREGGIRQALVTMVRNKYPSDKDGEEGIMAEATDAALAVMREQGGGVACSEIWPETLEIVGFRTFRNFVHKFKQGVAVLITGESGVGKSNFSDAEFYNITGESFKNPAMKSTVPRDLLKGGTVGYYAGVGVLGSERFRIRRGVTLSKAGTASESLFLDWWDAEAGDWNVKRFNDGGNADIQARIDALFGGSHIGQRTTNFGIQRDRKNLLFSKQDARKAVMLDAIGLSMLTACSRVLEKRRLDASQEAKAALSILQGMKAAVAGSEERLGALKSEIGESEAWIRENGGKAPEMEKGMEGVRGLLELGRQHLLQAQGALQALPNTEAAVLVARNAKEEREKVYARARLSRVEEWKGIKREEDRVLAEIQGVGEIPDLEEARKALADAEALSAEFAPKLDGFRVQEADARARVTSLLRDLEENAKEKGAYAGADIGKCSKCLRPMDTSEIEADLVRIEARRKELDAAVAVAREALSTASETLRKASEESQALITASKKLTASVHEIELKAQRLQGFQKVKDAVEARLRTCTEAGVKEKEDYERDLPVLAAAVETGERDHEANAAEKRRIQAEIGDISGSIEALNQELQAAALGLQRLTDGITNAETRIRENGAQILALEEKMVDVRKAEAEVPKKERAAKVAEIASSLLDPKAGLPLYLIDEALPAFEARINEYLDQLGTDRLQVRVQSPPGKPDDLDILVDNGGAGRLLDVLDYSGGQQQRIELACKFAMADIKRQFRGVTFGMCFWDEPTDSLSSYGKRAFLRILFERLATYPVTVVTSHDVEIIRDFSERLHFEVGADGETVLQGAA